MTLPYSGFFSESLPQIDWAKQNKHICVLPYSSLQFFHSSKSVSPCCNLIRDTNDQGLIHIKNLKEHISQSNLYSNCKDCYTCENEGKISERLRSIISLTEPQLKHFLEKQEVDDFYIHCTLSNLCNMACRSCNSATSTLYSKIQLGKIVKSNSIRDNIESWKIMLDSIKEMANKHPRVTVVISGGEGFIQEDFFTLIDWMIDSNISQKLNITINTNGTICDVKIITKLCQNFRKVSLAVSVDSIYDNYIYVRWPTKWDQIEQNLKEFDQFTDKFQNFTYFLTPVWSINNIFYIKEWVNYFAVKNLAAYDTPLFNPTWLDVQKLPQYLKNKLVPILSEVLEDPWLIKQKEFNANITNIRNSFLEKNSNFTQGGSWQMYLKNTAIWDVKTKTSLLENNKKLFTALSDNDKESYFKWLRRTGIEPDVFSL